MKVVLIEMFDVDNTDNTSFAKTEGEFEEFRSRVKNCYGDDVVLRHKSCQLNDATWDNFFHRANLKIDWQNMSQELKPEVVFTLAQPYEDSLYEEGFQKVNKNVWQKKVCLSDLNCSKAFIENVKNSKSSVSDKWLFAARCEYLLMRYRAQLAERVKNVIRDRIVNAIDDQVTFHRAAMSYATQHLTIDFDSDQLAKELRAANAIPKRADAIVSDVQPSESVEKNQTMAAVDAMTVAEEKPKRRRRKTAVEC